MKKVLLYWMIVTATLMAGQNHIPTLNFYTLAAGANHVPAPASLNPGTILWITDAQTSSDCSSAGGGTLLAMCYVTNLHTLASFGSSGSMTWPTTPGITVCTGTPCTAWGTTLTATGNGAKAVTSTGTQSQGAIVTIDANGNHTANAQFDDDITLASWLTYSDSGGIQANGFKFIGATPAVGHYLRSNGTKFVDNTIQTADVFANFTGCSGTMYPGYDGTCHTASGSMTYPSGTGFAIVSGGTAWGTTLGVTGTDANSPTTSDTSSNTPGNLVTVDANHGHSDSTIPKTAVTPLFSTVQGPTNTSTSIVTLSSTTMTTPGSDGTYRLTWEFVQSGAGVGCTTAGTFQVQLTYMSPDASGVGINGGSGLPSFTSRGGVSVVSTMAFQLNSLSDVAIWEPVPREFRAKQGTAIVIKLLQTVATAGCSTLPQYTFRPALYGPLGY